MCPLRIVLIFLSATLAGFFVLRNLKAPPESDGCSSGTDSSPSRSSKVISAIRSGFWTCVDMASGRYLWRHLIASKRSDWFFEGASFSGFMAVVGFSTLLALQLLTYS